MFTFPAKHLEMYFILKASEFIQEPVQCSCLDYFSCNTKCYWSNVNRALLQKKFKRYFVERGTGKI